MSSDNDDTAPVLMTDSASALAAESQQQQQQQGRKKEKETFMTNSFDLYFLAPVDVPHFQELLVRQQHRYITVLQHRNVRN